MARASTNSGRYTGVAILLHWAIALLVVMNIALGFRMGQLKGLEQFQLFQLHKSIGITIFLLTIARIAWRLTHRPPPYGPALKPWERTLATLTHGVFYVLMVALPLSGWIIVSASKYNIPTLLYGAVPWPHIAPIHGAAMPARERIAEVGIGTHELLAFTMLALVVLHVLAALKHQFLDGDDTLWRMTPGKPS